MANQGSERDQKLTGWRRQMAALHLRAAGASYDQIAEQLGYASRSGAWKAVDSVMRKQRLEGASEARMLDVQRLDLLLLAVWRKAKSGDTKAIGAVLRVMERRAKLLGLDAPTRYEIETFLRSEDWLKIKAALKAALEGFPEAADSVARALRRIGDE